MPTSSGLVYLLPDRICTSGGLGYFLREAAGPPGDQVTGAAVLGRPAELRSPCGTFAKQTCRAADQAAKPPS